MVYAVLQKHVHHLENNVEDGIMVAEGQLTVEIVQLQKPVLMENALIVHAVGMNNFNAEGWAAQFLCFGVVGGKDASAIL